MGLPPRSLLMTVIIPVIPNLPYVKDETYSLYLFAAKGTLAVDEFVLFF
jgi:hypothetical protein